MSVGRMRDGDRVLAQPRRSTHARAASVPWSCSRCEYLFEGRLETFDRSGPQVELFPFVSMFPVTSIAMLRERMAAHSNA